ncbi:hypothetical protein GGR42_000501 [Saonia flava]|uniref:Uncharacterized protein n=1 Tax=Saonia flava TaxID=523696 RepID=A0A846QZL1_9FLAO|nr:hypothetical protein [Saonia flava]
MGLTELNEFLAEKREGAFNVDGIITSYGYIDLNPLFCSF